MFKKFTPVIALLLTVAVLFSGCNGGQKKYQVTYLTLFDTVTTITGFDDNQQKFEEKAQALHDSLLNYHRLFDIYHDYEGIHNLKTVNDAAGIRPVKADTAIIDLLKDCKEYFTLTGGRVNIAMGSVLKLWHEARTAGLNDPEHAALPDSAALSEAAKHTDINALIIDENAGTVYLSDPEMSLDVGAVAKGWALQKAVSEAPEGLLISVGGNVFATGPKDSSGNGWVVGISDPDGGEKYLHTLSVTGGSVVTSGDYQRCYTVSGKSYHHIIDPDTCFPGTLWRSVTVICPDSGLADVLSTALFLLDQESGQALLDQCEAEAMWVPAEGSYLYSPGFEAYLKN